MRSAIRLALGFGWPVVFVAGLSAQASQAGKGFWFGYGAGFGVAQQSRTTCGPNYPPHCMSSSTSVVGIQPYLKLGGTASPFVRLGGELRVWHQFSDPGAGSETIVSIVGFLDYYPLGAKSGFFLTGGVGRSSLHSAVTDRCYLAQGCYDPQYGFYADDRAGASFVVGVGYALTTRRLSLAPSVRYVRQSFGTCDAYCPQHLFDLSLGVTHR